MTIGQPEDVHGGREEAGGRAGPSFTTLSTIAVRAGQSLIVISVLKSGSLVHLQLVQVHPGLSEIGSNHEECQILIQEQQQLMEKLQRHEKEVLSVVEKSERRKQTRRRTEGEEVYRAMTQSLKEGWLLLLRLMARRQEVLTLASDFYSRAREFAERINSIEKLIHHLLGKSLQVLTSSSILLQKLRQLQRTEAFQSRGGVLQEDEDNGEKEEDSQRCSGPALRVEELVEMLQDRRRRADQAFRLQLRQAEKLSVVHEKEHRCRDETTEEWRLCVDEILDQNQGSESEPEDGTDLRVESRTEETRELESGPTSDEESDPDLISRLTLKETKCPERYAGSDLQSGSPPSLPPVLGSGQNRDLKPGSKFVEPTIPQNRSRSDLLSNSRSEEITTFRSGLRSDLHPGSGLQKCSEKTKALQLESTSGSQFGSDSGLQAGLHFKPESGPDAFKNLHTDLKLNMRTWSTSDRTPGSGSRLDARSQSTSESATDLEPGSRLREITTLQFGIKLDLRAGSRSDLQSEPTSETGDLKSEFSTRNFGKRSRMGLKSESKLDQKPESQETEELCAEPETDVHPGSRSVETTETKSGISLGLKPESIQEEIEDPEPISGSDLLPKSRSEQTGQLQPESRPDLQPGSRLGLEPALSPDKKDLQQGSRPDLKKGSRSQHSKDLEPESSSDLTPGSRTGLQSRIRLEQNPGSRLEETKNLLSRLKLNSKTGSRPDQMLGSESDMQPGSRLDTESDSRPEQSRDKPVCRPEETRHLPTGSTSEESKDLQQESRSGLRHGSESEHSQGMKPGPRSEKTTYLQRECGSDLKPGSRTNFQSRTGLGITPVPRSEETKPMLSTFKLDFKFGSRSASGKDHGSRSDTECESGSQNTEDSEPLSTSEETRNLQSGLKVDLKTGVDLQSDSESTEPEESGDGSEETRVIIETGSLTTMMQESSLDRTPESRSEESKNKSEEITEHQPGSSSGLKPGSRPGNTLDLPPGLNKSKNLEPQTDVKQGSGSVEIPDLSLKERTNLQPGSRSEKKEHRQLGSGSEAEDLHFTKQKQETNQQRVETATTSSPQSSGLGSRLETETHSDHTHQSSLTNQRHQLLSSCEDLVDKVWSWVQQGSSVLSDSRETGRQLSEAEHTLDTHLQLHTQAESAGQDAEKMKQILDQFKALQTDLTSSLQPHGEPSRQTSSLKVLTEQLKKGSEGRPFRPDTAQPSPSAADLSGSLYSQLAGRVNLILKELQSLNRKIDSNLQLLQPYVTFLRMAQQVEEEIEIYRRSLEEEKKKKCVSSNFSLTDVFNSPKKKPNVASWQETLQRILTCQDLGNNVVNTVSKVSTAGLNVKVMVSVVQQTLERLHRAKQEVNKLLTQQETEIQQQQEYCRKYEERFLKTLQDLKCVSELLDSCTQMDLGSDLQTTRLLDHFTQARPHFKKLDAEVEILVKGWETLRGVGLEVTELGGPAVREEDLSEMLKLHERVKNKIRQSESILDQTSSFHLTSKRLEALLQSDPESLLTGLTGLCGSSEAEMRQHKEKQQQIQTLLKTISSLKNEICTAVNQKGPTCFTVEQLEARLLSLDSLCVSWLNDARQREQNQLLTRRFNSDINQVRDSFKELKKRFNNLKFNYMKRNDRTRNTKAVRNQSQQVEMYEEKLQALRKRLQGVTARLGSEVKDGGVAREAEDAINELQRQMGEFERGVSEHQKTLEMTCKLQRAVEEYQFWCEEASATIARVGKFSSQCRSTEAVSVLYQQFEKFVWPTVPQQEERISQISQLAVRLHGVEEGQRYIEKTVSKHSEMVKSIRELSDGLLELEAKLKKENLKQQQQKEREKEMKEEEERRKSETEEKDEGKKGNRKWKNKEQTDNRSTQERTEMYELKETGHTPELTKEHDGKEVPVKRQTAANKKPPFQKSRSQEVDSVGSEDRQHSSSSSFCSTHTFSLSCSPMLASRRIHAIHSQSQPVEPQATPPLPSFSDIPRELQRKDTQERSQQDASAGGLSETELQQQEVMLEDYLSNDEYECVSPDDISLPPLAETPESIMVQSDAEEGVCFSSHSVHINQCSHQYHAPSEHWGNSSAGGAVSCSTPPPSLPSSTRFRSESSSLVQSVLTVPFSSPLTSTLCSILVTEETNKTSVSQRVEHSSGSQGPRLASESNAALNSTHSHKDNNVTEKSISSGTWPQMKKHNPPLNEPQMTVGTWDKVTQNAASTGETLTQSKPSPQTVELNHSPTSPNSSYDPPQPPDPDLNLQKDETPPQDPRFLKSCTTFSQSRTSISQDKTVLQSCPGSGSKASSQTENPLSRPQKGGQNSTGVSSVSQHIIYQSTSNSIRNSAQAFSSPSSVKERPERKTEPVSNRTESASHRESNPPVEMKSSETSVQTSMPLSRNSNLQQSHPDPTSGNDQDVLSSQSSKEASSVSMPQSSSQTTTTTVIQQTKTVTPESPCNMLQANSDVRSKQESPLSHGSRGLPEVHGTVIQEPICPSNISTSSSAITSSNSFSSQQSHQTVHTSHGSTCTQQCVHDTGMTPGSSARPAAPPQPEAQTQALAQQANPHVTPLSSPPHLLTPDQDPNICQPTAIREEIKLTPQIQGPSLPAPPVPQAQAESLPQGKASKPGPSCFTRPLSRAIVMEGSPVTLEVEVAGHLQPALTWSKEGESSDPGPGRALACEDGKRFHYIPEASDSDGGLYEARAATRHESLKEAGNSSGGERWLVTEVLNIISVDWLTWFGTLCVLLWLLYLILL
ncbi:uncharacterized protein ccdc141 [Cheilinus undulatus]|uniref:uncharacterized protein ccdc141 n=1 Tax=Cheilinus undulatus TaxID=241271 RepID=UPI001BD53828|nr:uncharacterized protein ccdc141 [Cheilinus undulatus]